MRETEIQSYREIQKQTQGCRDRDRDRGTETQRDNDIDRHRQRCGERDQ